MIKDTLKNVNSYKNLPLNIQKGLNWLCHTDFDSFEDGKYIISDNIYVNIQTYITKSDADYEAHRDYADIQYIISGKEQIGVCDYKLCLPKIPYDKEKDIEFLGVNNEVVNNDEYIEMKEGDFMILYPEDAHKPSITINEPVRVRKAVVKVKIND